MKKNIKLSLIVLLSLTLMIGLAACGSQEKEPSEKPAEIDSKVSEHMESSQDANEEKSQAQDSSEEKEKDDPRLSNGVIDGTNFEKVMKEIPDDFNMVEYYERTQDHLEGTWEVGGVDRAFVTNVKRGQPHPTYSYDMKSDENKALMTLDLVASNGNITYLVNCVKVVKGDVFNGEEAAAWIKDNQDKDRASTVIGDAKLILSQNAQGVKGSRSLFIQALGKDGAQ